MMMALIRKLLSAEALTAITFNLIMLANCSCQAQGPLLPQNNDPLESPARSLGSTLYSAVHEAANLGSAPAPADTSTPADNQWHIGFAPYLWFAGMHGSVGAYGLNTSVKASPGDLLSHADVGLMGTVEASKERWVIPVDFIWLALSDDKGVPENEPGVESITFRAGEFILTPKVGYKIIDKPKLNADFTVGVRYWHLGERFHFNPILYNGFTTSQDWADVVGGLRMEMPLSPKASITVLGDGGKGGAIEDYQIAGLLNYKIKKNLTLFGGWRYLDVDYRNNKLFLYNMTVSGVGLGAVFWFK
jgi:hypothetical protein